MASSTSPVFFDKDGVPIHFKKRKARFTFPEIHVLLDEVRKNRNIIVGQFNAGVPCKLKKRTWAEITARINEIGECDREVIEVIKKWSDMKCDTKRKVAALRTGKSFPGKRLTLEFSPTEKIVRQILELDGKQASGSAGNSARRRIFGRRTRNGNAKLFDEDEGGAPIAEDESMDSDVASARTDPSPLRLPTPQETTSSSSVYPSPMVTPPPFPDALETSDHDFPLDTSGDTSDLFDTSFEAPSADDSREPMEPANNNKSSSLPPTTANRTVPTASLTNGIAGGSVVARPLFNSAPQPSSSSSTAPTTRPLTSTPSPRVATQQQQPAQQEDGAASRVGEDVAHAAALSVQEQQMSNALLETVSRSLELLAESLQQLAETQQDYMRESLQIQKETVQVLQDFASGAMTILTKSKLNAGHSTD